MIYRTLIEPRCLNAHLDAPGWIVVDCRFDLADPEAGRAAYREGHIRGARYAHLDEDLSGHRTPRSGRHPLPAPSQLAHTLGQWGIGDTTQVIAYDSSGGAMAARLWWLLRWLGHKRCALLDGGLPAWQREGLPVTAKQPTVIPTKITDRHNDALWVDSQSVLANIDRGDDLLIDARGASRYRGDEEPLDPVAGHVPGAVNLPLTGNLGPDGCFLGAATLRERFMAAIDGKSSKHVLHMCGSGVTACHNLLAMEVAGLTGSRLYAGSWSEWIRDPNRPVAKD